MVNILQREKDGLGDTRGHWCSLILVLSIFLMLLDVHQDPKPIYSTKHALGCLRYVVLGTMYAHYEVI